MKKNQKKKYLTIDKRQNSRKRKLIFNAYKQIKPQYFVCL